MSKSVIFTKVAISLLLTNFSFANLAPKSSSVNLLNSGAVMYLLWSCILFPAAARAVVVDKLVMLHVLVLALFLLALRVIAVAKLVKPDISFLTSFILWLRKALVAKLVIWGVLSLIFLILALYTFL